MKVFPPSLVALGVLYRLIRFFPALCLHAKKRHEMSLLEESLILAGVATFSGRIRYCL